MEEIGKYILATKIALATAIIRSKPEGLTGMQYCTSLCATYTDKTGKKLIEKNKQLEEQVLFLRQRLHLERSVNSAEQVTQNSENEVFLTPPSSSEEPATSRLDHLQHSFSQHAHFLNSLRPICQISESSNSNISLEIIKETSKSTIKGIKEALQEKIVSSHVEDAMKKSARALGQLCGRNRSVLQLLRTDIEELASTLTDTIMSDKDLNNIETQYSRSKLLLSLGNCSSLKPIILDVIIQVVTPAINTLSKPTTQAKHGLDPVLHDNLYYLLWCIEELLQPECVISPRDRQLDANQHGKILDHLESLLYLTDSLPLVYMYIMKLIRILEFLQQTDTTVKM